MKKFNKKIKFSLLIINILIMFGLCINNVHAVGYSINPSAGGGTAPTCNSGVNCLTMGTAGVRFALVKKDGSVVGGRTHIRDYWFYDDPNVHGNDCQNYNNCGYDYLYFSNEVNHYAFDQKYLKQDLEKYVGDKSFYNPVTYAESEAQSDGTDFTQLHAKRGYGSFTTLDSFAGIYNNSNPAAYGYRKEVYWWGESYNDFQNQVKPHVRRAYSVDYIASLIKEQYNTDNTSILLDNILRAMGYNDAEISSYKRKGYYLQVEPLVTWGNVNGGTHVFYGTVTELVLFMNTIRIPGGIASHFYGYNFTNNFFGQYHEYGIYAHDKDNMPTNFEPIDDASGKYSDFVKRAPNGKLYAYGVGYIFLPKDNTCPSLVADAYAEFKKSGFKNIDAYDNAVLEACEEAGVGQCEWLTWNSYSNGKKNVGGNYKNYGLESDLANHTLESCERPSCNDVATKKFGAPLINETSWGINSDGQLLEKMINDVTASDAATKIKNNPWWGSLSFQNVFRYLTITYSSDLKFGSRADGTFNNMIMRKVLGNNIPSSDNNCGVSTCQSVLAKYQKSELKNKIYGKTILEWLYLMFPKYDMLSPEFLANDDGVIDYNLAACQGTPECNTKTVAASCKKNQNEFTFTDLISDENYNGGAEFEMTVDTFAKLTSGTYSSNPTCLNAGYAYTSINGAKLERKNYQKSKSNEEYNGESTCWQSVSFDLPLSVGDDSIIEAGTVFRWGKGSNKDTSNNVFGNMTVRRICSVKPVDSSINTLLIGSEFANVVDGKPLIGATVNTNGTSTGISSAVYNSRAEINPDIRIHYQEAVPESLISEYPEKEYKMDVELKTVTTNIYARTTVNGANLTSGIDYDTIDYEDSVCGNPTNTLDQCIASLGSGDHPRRATLTRSGHSFFFTNGGVVETTATYKIVYNDSLKWYSDKADNFKKTTETEIKNNGKDSNDSNYLLLGYGLPSSFVTPPLPKGKYYFGYSIDSADKRGKMYATIKNIGTKNSTGAYHFDGLLRTSKNVLLDDDTNGTFTDSLVYSCGFNLKNRIYGNEWDDSGIITPDDDCVSGICKVPNNVPKGIDVVFRTVKLVDSHGDIDDNIAKLFPGRSGSGREVGANWRIMFGKEVNDGSIVDFFSEKTYDKDPKYVIELTPTLIQNIRKENKGSVYTSLSDYEFYKYRPGISEYSASDASSFLVDCVGKGDSTKCSKASIALEVYSLGQVNKQTEYEYTRAGSDYLSELIKKGNLKGTCAEESDTKKRTEKYAKNLGC